VRGADSGRPVNWAGIVDIAQAATEASTGRRHAGRVYETRGPLWALLQPAGILVEVSGRPLVHQDVPASSLGPAAFLHELITSGVFAEPGDDLLALLGRPATALRDLVTIALTGHANRVMS